MPNYDGCVTTRGANHVQIDVNKATVQVLVSLDCRGMIAVFPECAVASFPLIVFLATAASDQLHAIGDDVWTGIFNQKVNVVAGHYVIKYGKTEALFRFEKPAQVTSADRAQTSVENSFDGSDE